MTSSSITQAAFLSPTVMGDDDESTPTAARRRKATSSATATSAATASKSGSGQEQEREKSRSARNGSRWVMKYTMLQSQLIISFGEIMIVFLLMNLCGEKKWIAKRTSPYLGFNSCNSIQSHFSANRQSQRRRNRRNLKRRRSRKERTLCPQTKWCARPPHRQGWMVFCN